MNRRVFSSLLSAMLCVGLLAHAQDAVAQKLPRVKVDYDAQRVLYYDASNRVQWSTPLTGLDSQKLLCDSERVYVRHGDGVTALDIRTGAEIWHSQGPNECLFLCDDLLFTLGRYSNSDPIGWLLGRKKADGSETVKVNLQYFVQPGCSLRELGGMIVAEDQLRNAILFDRSGKEIFRCRRIMDIVQAGSNYLMLTGTFVQKMSGDYSRSEALFPLGFGRGFADSGKIIKLPDGEFVAYRYSGSSDSGVSMVRFDAAYRPVWMTSCRPLGVRSQPDQYYHMVSAVVEGKTLVVKSAASEGAFVETLDLETGVQLKRVVKEK